MLFGYSYSEGLEAPSATKPWLLKIDECKEMGSISLEHQRTLGKEFPFAEEAYLFHSDAAYVKSQLNDPADWVPVQPNEACPTDKKWLPQLMQLKSFGIVMIVTTVAMLAYSTYFAIEKAGKNVARSIFSGAAVSRLFKRPPPVNLPHIPLVLRTLSRILRGRPCWLLLGDLRNYFHQIALHESVSRIFSVLCDGLTFSWRCAPMGHSYSPRHAQSLAWAALLKEATAENGLLDLAATMKKSQHPPAFGILRDAAGAEAGLVMIWYDNFVIFCLDQNMTNHLARTLKQMSTSSGFVWGEKQLFHPNQLERLFTADVDKLTPVEKTWACALGIQFALTKRDSQGLRAFRWRLKPKTAERAELLRRQLLGVDEMERIPFSCRMVSKIVGSAIWHAYIASRPLLDLHDVIEITRNVALVVARTKCWDSVFHLSDLQTSHLKTCLDKIIANEWQYDWATYTGDTVFAASDASDDKGAWVILLSEQVHGLSDNWPLQKSEHIFLKELRSAVRAIQELAPQDGTLVLAIDNTAAAHVLKNFYSSSSIGRTLAKQAFDCLRERRCRLIVVGILGVDNFADSPTRDLPWCEKRRKKTWDTLQAALAGHERKEVNPNRRGASSHEDDDSDQLLEELKALDSDTLIP